MKLQFLHALIVPGHAPDLRKTHSLAVRALPHAAAASHDTSVKRSRIKCRWQRNSSSGRLEARWSTQD
jgi:hypothetical protein